MGETQQQTQAPARGSAIDRLSGTFDDAQAVNQRLAWAIENAHLVSPVTAVSRLPEGVGVALSIERVNVERDTYGLPGNKRALLKPALERIGRAAGVRWDPEQCWTRMIGPFHARARAVGYVTDLSFKDSAVVGEVDLDYGPGSIGEQKVYADAKDKGMAEKTLREIRHFLLRHAESRAYLRAIRRLGIATSYTPEQLAKPFVALQLTWTGRSADPETQRELTRMTAARMLGASESLYGRREQPAERAPELSSSAPSVPPTLDATPRPLPATTRREPIDSMLDFDEETGEVVPAARPAPRRDQTPAPAARSSVSTSSSRGDGQPSRSGPVVRFGRNKDKALSEVSLDDLSFYRAKIAEGADDPDKSRFRDDALRHLDEIDRAIAASRGEDSEPSGDSAPPTADVDGY